MAFKGSRWTISNILPLLLILSIVGVIWASYVFLHVVPLLRDPLSFARGRAEAMVSQVLTALLLICFGRAVFTDPGSVPLTLEWSPQSQVPNTQWKEHVLLPAQQEFKHTGERRFCKWCKAYKPDRCHHCRVCKSCILRMDHHCPWIANCVGFRNHKFFFLLVFYALLNCIFTVLTMPEALVSAMETETDATHRFFVVFGMTLAAIMGFLLTLFFGLHVWLMLRATTTIEFCEKRYRCARGGTMPNYEQGLYDNIRAVLGPHPLLWFLPTMPPAGDGLSFPVVSGTDRDFSSADESEALLADWRRGLPRDRRSSDIEADAPPEVTSSPSATK